MAEFDFFLGQLNTIRLFDSYTEHSDFLKGRSLLFYLFHDCFEDWIEELRRNRSFCLCFFFFILCLFRIRATSSFNDKVSIVHHIFKCIEEFISVFTVQLRSMALWWTIIIFIVLVWIWIFKPFSFIIVILIFVSNFIIIKNPLFSINIKNMKSFSSSIHNHIFRIL